MAYSNTGQNNPASSRRNRESGQGRGGQFSQEQSDQRAMGQEYGQNPAQNLDQESMGQAYSSQQGSSSRGSERQSSRSRTRRSNQPASEEPVSVGPEGFVYLDPAFGQYGRHQYGIDMGYGHEVFNPQTEEFTAIGQGRNIGRYAPISQPAMGMGQTGMPQRGQHSQPSYSQLYEQRQYRTAPSQQYGRTTSMQGAGGEFSDWGREAAIGAMPIYMWESRQTWPALEARSQYPGEPRLSTPEMYGQQSGMGREQYQQPYEQQYETVAVIEEYIEPQQYEAGRDQYRQPYGQQYAMAPAETQAFEAPGTTMTTEGAALSSWGLRRERYQPPFEQQYGQRYEQRQFQPEQYGPRMSRQEFGSEFTPYGREEAEEGSIPIYEWESRQTWPALEERSRYASELRPFGQEQYGQRQMGGYGQERYTEPWQSGERESIMPLTGQQYSPSYGPAYGTEEYGRSGEFGHEGWTGRYGEFGEYGRRGTGQEFMPERYRQEQYQPPYEQQYGMELPESQAFETPGTTAITEGAALSSWGMGREQFQPSYGQQYRSEVMESQAYQPYYMRQQGMGREQFQPSYTQPSQPQYQPTSGKEGYGYGTEQYGPREGQPCQTGESSQPYSCDQFYTARYSQQGQGNVNIAGEEVPGYIQVGQGSESEQQPIRYEGEQSIGEQQTSVSGPQQSNQPRAQPFETVSEPYSSQAEEYGREMREEYGRIEPQDQFGGPGSAEYSGVAPTLGAIGQTTFSPSEQPFRGMGQTECLMASELGPYTGQSSYQSGQRGSLESYRRERCGL